MWKSLHCPKLIDLADNCACFSFLMIIYDFFFSWFVHAFCTRCPHLYYLAKFSFSYSLYPRQLSLLNFQGLIKTRLYFTKNVLQTIEQLYLLQLYYTATQRMLHYLYRLPIKAFKHRPIISFLLSSELRSSKIVVLFFSPRLLLFLSLFYYFSSCSWRKVSSERPSEFIGHMHKHVVVAYRVHLVAKSTDLYLSI